MSKTTECNATNCIDLCRNLYNVALSQRISIYRQNKGHISCYDQQKQLRELKEAFPEYKKINAQVLYGVLERLDYAFAKFFRSLKGKEKVKVGFPRFKGTNRYNSFVLKHNGWRVEGRYLILTNIGRFKMRLSRPIEGKIRTVTILREHGKWYVCFSCDNVPESRLANSGASVGLDVGIKSFLVDSDGNTVDNPQYFRTSEALIKRRNRVLCRRKKGSHGRNKARILVAKAHNHVKNQRIDFLHKLSTKYVNTYGTLVFENLNVGGMIKNHHLAKSINDVGWCRFYEFCVYKAEEAGRQIIRIPRFEPTSKRCSGCGAINQELKLSDREWICKECGILHDRDFNAAKNILRVGQTLQAQTCAGAQSVACESQAYRDGNAKDYYVTTTRGSPVVIISN